MMIKKESIIRALSEFPEEIFLDDLVEKLILIQKIETGINQSENDEILSEEDAKSKLKKWQK